MRNRLPTLLLYVSIALMGFAIGCLANYFWLFNHNEQTPLGAGCTTYETGLDNPAHLAVGAVSLLVSLFSICSLVHTVHED